MRSSRAKKAQKAAKKPPSAPARVELALALGAGRVGLTLGRPVGLGPSGVDEIVASLRAAARPGDTIAILSNGAFGDIYTKLLNALGTP